MKLSILVYSTTKDTFSGHHFINTTGHYAQLPPNSKLHKTLSRNIACRIRYSLIGSIATTALITNFALASLLRLTNIFTNSLQPLSKKTIYPLSRTIYHPRSMHKRLHPRTSIRHTYTLGHRPN